MIRSGGRFRFFSGIIILAFLLVSTFNIHVLSVLINPELLGRPVGVKLASQKWQELENLHQARRRSAVGQLNPDHVLPNLTRGFVQHEMFLEPKAKSGAADAEAPPQPVDSSMPLPVLAGIVQTVDARRGIRWQAYLNGDLYRPGDVIDGLRVMSISVEGVRLGKADRRWFLAAPPVGFSVSDEPEK